MSLSDPPFPYSKRSIWVSRETVWQRRPVLWTAIIGVLFWVAISEILVAVIEWVAITSQSGPVS